MPATEAEVRELYERYAHVVHHRARGILGTDEDAADAVQETFARVIRSWDSFRQQSSPLTWIVQISTNYCLNRLRDERGHARKHDQRRHELVQEPLAPDGAHRVDAGRLRSLLADEDDETRRILVHLYFDDMTREDTARLVGVSVPTLRKRHELFLRRARRALGIAPAVTLALATLLLLQVRG